MASGAAAMPGICKMGIPTGMIFVRNDAGSRNPDEAMTLTISASAQTCWGCC